MIKDINDKIINIAKEKFEDKKIVLGEGVTNSLMLIGEAPGGQEEKMGKPFVGAAGKNLNQFLEIVDLKREEIYITNVVKLRPCKLNEKTNRIINRKPGKDELNVFTPLLLEEIKEVNPTMIVTLGNFALKAVLKDDKAAIGDYHGKVVENSDRLKIFPLYHPASIIYDEKLKETYIQDLNKLKEILHN